MFWRRVAHRDGPNSPAAVACRLHSFWLSDAIESGRWYPRIPTRRVGAGGFRSLMTQPKGPRVAERWWRAALAHAD